AAANSDWTTCSVTRAGLSGSTWMIICCPTTLKSIGAARVKNLLGAASSWTDRSFQQPFNHPNEFAIGLALIGPESHVFVRHIALLVDDYDRRHGVQTERLVDHLIGVTQRRDFQIMLLRERLQVCVGSVIARAGLRAIDAHPVNLHSARRITI